MFRYSFSIYRFSFENKSSSDAATENTNIGQIQFRYSEPFTIHLLGTLFGRIQFSKESIGYVKRNYTTKINDNIVLRVEQNILALRIISMGGYLCKSLRIETYIDLVHLISSNKQRLYLTSISLEGQQHRLMSQMKLMRKEISLDTNYILHSVSRFFRPFAYFLQSHDDIITIICTIACFCYKVVLKLATEKVETRGTCQSLTLFNPALSIG